MTVLYIVPRGIFHFSVSAEIEGEFWSLVLPPTVREKTPREGLSTCPSFRERSGRRKSPRKSITSWKEGPRSTSKKGYSCPCSFKACPSQSGGSAGGSVSVYPPTRGRKKNRGGGPMRFGEP